MLFYSLIVLAPIIVLKRDGHLLKQPIAFERGFVHITFNLVFDLKISEPDRYPGTEKWISCMLDPGLYCQAYS